VRSARIARPVRPPTAARSAESSDVVNAGGRDPPRRFHRLGRVACQVSQAPDRLGVRHSGRGASTRADLRFPASSAGTSVVAIGASGLGPPQISGAASSPVRRACEASRRPEAAKAAIGEHPATGLAARAVVRFVVGVTDSENTRAAPGARFSVASMNGHALAKRSDLLREPLARLGTQAPEPEFRACRASPRTGGPFRPRQRAGQSKRREPGGVENPSEYAFPMPLTMRDLSAPASKSVFAAQRARKRFEIG